MCRSRGFRFGVVFLAGIVLAVGSVRGENASHEDLDFSLYDSYGRQVRSQDYKGVPVFLEFGACW